LTVRITIGYNRRHQPDATMNTNLIAATSAAAFLSLLGGFAMGAREIKTVRTDFETRAKILERAATSAQENADKATANARSLETQVIALKESRQRSYAESGDKISDLTMKLRQFELGQEQKDKLAKLQMARAKDAFGRIDSRRPLTVDEVVTIAHAFRDIQHQVAAGEFPGLNLTVAYGRLKELLDNADIDRLIADYDTATGR
jgi:hypothetical protein